MCFPPSFFDIMEHLMIHMVNQITELGPVYFHQMWAYKRFMSILNGYMRNSSNPEGSMMEGYHTEEHIDCCIDYIKDKRAIGLYKSPHEGRLLGIGKWGMKRFIDSAYVAVEQAHSSVLQQLTIVWLLLKEHKDEICAQSNGRLEDWIVKEHKHMFLAWLKKQKLSEEDSTDARTIQLLACGPSNMVTSWQV
jgi:hypothetical protein